MLGAVTQFESSTKTTPTAHLGARRVLWRAGVAIALALLLLGVAGALWGRSWLAYAIVVSPNRHEQFDATTDPSAESYRRYGVDRQLRIEIGMPWPSSQALWILEPEAAPRGTVLLLHGIRSDKRWLVPFGRTLSKHGYRVVLPDLRGHGFSTGDWLTYGVRETHDLSVLLDAMGDTPRPVGVLGVSYGAAVAIQWAAADERVQAVVAVAPFTSLNAVVRNYVHYYVPGVAGLIPDWFVQQGIDRAGELGGFDPARASPLAAIARTRAPVLLLHGEDDAHIPPEHSRALHAAAPAHSKLVVLPHEDHFSLLSMDGGVDDRSIAWFRRRL
ncbi:MAG TPA: alpha/beta fold hydrolase [Polyangiaceae bacterium]